MTLPVADRWFEAKPVDDAITMLWEPHLHPVLQSNIWFIRGSERDLLVDAGMGIGDLAGAIAGLTSKPLIAFATHRHADHIGGLHQFPARYAHPADAEEMAHPASFASLLVADYPEEFVAFMKREGYDVGTEMIDAHPCEGYDAGAYVLRPAPPTHLVEDGDEIDLGDRVLRVMHLPGHSPGSVGLVDERNGILFSGDAIYDGPLYDFLPESDIPDYVRTMRRLLEIPVSVVHGGHDPSFGQQRLTEIATAYVERRAAHEETARSRTA